MKIIVSQDGRQCFTMGENNLIHIATVKIDGTDMEVYSLGIENVSFGMFKNEKKCMNVLDEIVSFLCGKGERFRVPRD